jgi:hypothetical protein
MRGSTLLFHSLEALDPESFERVDDIEEALEPELYFSDTRRDPHHHYSKSSRNQRTSQTAPLNLHRHSTRNLGQRVPVPSDNFTSKLSPPLTKSNYYIEEPEEFKENQIFNYQYRRGSSSSTDSGHSSASTSSNEDSNKAESAIGRKNIMSFHNFSRDDGKKTFTSFGSAMPLSKLKSERSGGGSSHSFSQGSHKNTTCGDESRNSHHESGFSRFFGLKSNKTEKNRFDVNNLPPQLKSELKQIYVY